MSSSKLSVMQNMVRFGEQKSTEKKHKKISSDMMNNMIFGGGHDFICPNTDLLYAQERHETLDLG